MDCLLEAYKKKMTMGRAVFFACYTTGKLFLKVKMSRVDRTVYRGIPAHISRHLKWERLHQERTIYGHDIRGGTIRRAKMTLQMEPITDASAWSGEDLERDQYCKCNPPVTRSLLCLLIIS
jgi:hypothetical protein